MTEHPTTVMAPTFRMKLFNMDEKNEYIIQGFQWEKNSGLEIINEIARLSSALVTMGILPTMKLKELTVGENAFGVAIMNHPEFGPLRIALVGGPDYSVVEQALDPAIEAKIIEEKATFKLNIHPRVENKQ